MAWDATKPDLDPLTGTDFDDADGHFRDNYEWLELALAEFCNFPGSLDYLDEMGAPKGRRYNAAGRAGLTPVEGMWILRSDRKCLDNYRSTSWHAYHMAIVGEMTLAAFSPASPPDGWLACDGSAVSRTTYAELFAVIGTAFGAGDGSTTFNVPNLGGRVPVGEDTGDADFDVIGETGGAKEVTLDSDELPTHDHTVSNGGEHGITGSPRSETGDAHKMPIYTGGGGSALYESALPGAADFTYPSEPTARGAHTHTVLQQADPKDGAHNNVQPYLVNDFMIFAGS